MNGKLKARFWIPGLLILAWLVYGIGGQSIAGWVAGLLERQLNGLADGKFADPQVFVRGRMREALFLLTGAWVGATAVFIAFRKIDTQTVIPRVYPRAMMIFVVLNLWLAMAGNCVLFWLLFWQGEGTPNLVGFEIKRLLFKENKAESKMIIMGSSQANRQFKEALLNRQFGNRLWTTELGFPGNKVFDVWSIWERLPENRPALVAYYLNEGDFMDSSGLAPIYFFDAGAANVWRRLGTGRVPMTRKMYNGLIGSAIPLFRIRDALASRFLGKAMAGMNQADHDTAMASDLNRRAALVKDRFRRDAYTDLHRSALVELAGDCQRRGTKLILLFGQLNPLLERQLDGRLRAEVGSFLEELDARFANVTLIQREKMPEQTTEDYEDLTHVNDEAQKRFTEWFGAWVERENLVGRRD